MNRIFESQQVHRYFENRLAGIRWQGKQGVALCPFHRDHKPSLSVNTEKCAFHCHACGAEGGLFDFEARLTDCDKAEAKRRLAHLLRKPDSSKPRTNQIFYSYHDERGRHLYDQVRSDPKRFAFRRPNGAGGWIWSLQGVRRVPYRLRELLAAETVWIAEGEKDVETLRNLGLVATCNPGGAGKWRDEYSPFLKGKKIFILQDDDGPGRKHALHVAESVAKHAAQVKLLPPFRGSKDVSEWFDNGGTLKRLLKIAANAPTFKSADTKNQANSLQPVDAPRGDVLVLQLERFFMNYLILPSGIPFVLALWVIATHLFRRFDSFGYLTITSPAKRCGKTRLAELLCMVCARARMTTNISEAALFRTISHFEPTLIIDEAEGLSNRLSERSQSLREIINAGHRPGAPVVRCVGKDFVPTEFDVFGPKVIIAIGDVPDTIRDRSILIPMRRRRPAEQVDRFRFRQVKARGQELSAMAALWAEERGEQVQKAYESQALQFLGDRDADIWEALFAVASVAVPKGLEELREIAERLSAEKGRLDLDDSLPIGLLSDLRGIFMKYKTTMISTGDILLDLRSLPESQWDELTPSKIAKLLRPFKVGPRQLWIGERNVRGYDLGDLKPLFDTYLPVRSR